MKHYKCVCGWDVFANTNAIFACPSCRSEIQISGLKAKSNWKIGDIAERFFVTVGVARLAKLYEQFTGKSCGCAKRKTILNRLGARLSEWMDSIVS